MQTANHEMREDPLPPRTLEFRQAMKDFRTMFPTLEAELIECVLRSNGGHVDSTIDQLLQLSQDSSGNNLRNQAFMRQRNRCTYDDSTDSDDSIPSELLDPPTSSDDEDVPVREPPPMYTPRAGESPSSFFGSGFPVEVPISDKKKGAHKEKNRHNSRQNKMTKKSYRAWNPPMLGTLPEDFLRILPQQFMDTSLTKEKSKKNPVPSKRRTSPSRFAELNSEKQSSNHIQNHNSRKPLTRPEQFNSSTNSATINYPPQSIIEGHPGPVPPPRPSRTIDSHRSRRIHQGDNIEHGHLFIQPAAFPADNQFHPIQSFDHSDLSNGHRNRHHHRRSNHGRTCSQHQSRSHQSSTTASTNGYPPRRHSDFTSHRMVMVPSRASEPNMPLHSNEPNGFHSPLPGDRPPHRHRSSRSSYHHHHHSPSNQTPSVSRDMASGSPVTNLPSRSSSSSNSGNRTRQRTRYEEEQYVEDCRLAILLQNEEFISELKRNEEFLKALEKDRNKDSESTEKPVELISSQRISPKEDSVVPLPDPDAKYPHGSRNVTSLKRVGMEDPEKEDESAFKENLKHMGKSARKKFNEIARKFSVKKKSSYKSMRNIDPVFANCDDNFDDIRRPQSPVFEL